MAKSAPSIGTPCISPQWLDPLLAEFDHLALGAFRNVEPQAKADNSAVTALDKAASDLAKRTLLRLFPDAGFISEEDEPYLPDASYQWVLDPIDGTASFVRGYPVWGLGLGLMKDRVPIEGCLRFPLLDETYLFTGSGNYLNGKELHPPPPPTLRDVENILIGSSLHAVVPLDKLKSYKLRNLGSNLYHIAALAAGRSEAIITPQAYIWDIVPAIPFTRAQGHVERYLDGTLFSIHDLFRETPPNFRLAQPLVIGPPKWVQEIVSLLG